MRFQKETEQKQSRKLDESWERITFQQPTQENFRKNVNIVKFCQKSKKIAKGSQSKKIAKGSGSEIMCDVSKQIQQSTFRQVYILSNSVPYL